MLEARGTSRRLAAAAIALLALPGALHGCSSPTAPPPPPSGGETLVLDYDRFAAEVEPVLVQHGCDQTGDCHGGGIRGTLELSPPGAKDPQFDFEQVVQQVSAADPEHSRILTEPLALAAGGTPHSFKPFADTTDVDFQAIRGWIRAGERR